eukprot:gene4851-8436_t
MKQLKNHFLKQISRSYSLLKGSKYGLVLQYEKFLATPTEENEMTIEFMKDLKYPFIIYFENESILSKSKLISKFKEQYPLSAKKIIDNEIISQEDAITSIINEFDSTLICGDSFDKNESAEYLETTKKEEFDSVIFLNPKEENFEKLNEIMKKNPKIQIFSCKNLELFEKYKQFLSSKNENSNIHARVINENLLIELLIKHRIQEMNTKQPLQKIYFISDSQIFKDRPDNFINVVINQKSGIKSLKSFMMSLISLSQEEKKILSQ